MKINFHSVLPDPFSSITNQTESIWNSTFELDSTKQKKVLISASSGKGKTTFVNMLVGLRRDYSGEIYINHKNIRSLTIEEWVDIRANKISVIHQDLQLFPNLTAVENIDLKNELTNTLSKIEIEKLLVEVGLIDRKNQQLATMSMGQKQRIAIVRALCQPFEWLVLDEPFSHLDDENTEICFKMIHERCQHLKAGFILTSLDLFKNYQFDVSRKLE